MISILCNGPRAWASSRLRGYWYADEAPTKFNAFEPGAFLDGLEDSETVVFQKRQEPIDYERARRLKSEGRKIIYDLTDPMWLFNPPGTRAMMTVADCITTSNAGLAIQIADMPEAAGKEVVCIPDRMPPSFHPTVAEHGERERLVFVWFGAGNNRWTIASGLQLLGFLAYHVPLELRVIDDHPEIKLAQEDMPHGNIEMVTWKLETFHANLVSADIAFLPPHPGPWGMMKSNNKTVTAWWAGLPVVDGWDLDDMRTLALDADKRAEVGRDNRKAAEDLYDIKDSVQEWLDLNERLHGRVAALNPNGSQSLEMGYVDTVQGHRP